MLVQLAIDPISTALSDGFSQPPLVSGALPQHPIEHIVVALAHDGQVPVGVVSVGVAAASGSDVADFAVGSAGEELAAVNFDGVPVSFPRSHCIRGVRVR